MDFNFDDDVFVSKEERTIPEQEPYTAKEEVDGVLCRSRARRKHCLLTCCSGSITLTALKN